MTDTMNIERKLFNGNGILHTIKVLKFVLSQWEQGKLAIMQNLRILNVGNHFSKL